MPIATPNFRRIGLVLGLAAALTVAGASSQSVVSVAVAPAAAATKHNVSRPYVHNWVFRSTKLKRCLFIAAEGSMVGTWEYLYGDDTDDKDSLWWTKMRLKDPTISVTAWPFRGAGCDSTKKLRLRAELEQGWYQTGCNLDVDVSLAAPPWESSADVDYNCGRNKVAHRESSEGPAKATLNQFNSGHPVKYENTSASVKAGGVGFTGVIIVRGHTKSSSDQVRRTLHLTLNK